MEDRTIYKKLDNDVLEELVEYEPEDAYLIGYKIQLGAYFHMDEPLRRYSFKNLLKHLFKNDIDLRQHGKEIERASESHVVFPYNTIICILEKHEYEEWNKLHIIPQKEAAEKIQQTLNAVADRYQDMISDINRDFIMESGNKEFYTQ